MSRHFRRFRALQCGCQGASCHCFDRRCCALAFASSISSWLWTICLLFRHHLSPRVTTCHHLLPKLHLSCILFRIRICMDLLSFAHLAAVFSTKSQRVWKDWLTGKMSVEENGRWMDMAVSWQVMGLLYLVEPWSKWPGREIMLGGGAHPPNSIEQLIKEPDGAAGFGNCWSYLKSRDIYMFVTYLHLFAFSIIFVS